MREDERKKQASAAVRGDEGGVEHVGDVAPHRDVSRRIATYRDVSPGAHVPVDDQSADPEDVPPPR